MVDETQCPAHQCGIACTNCGVVPECDCLEAVSNALKAWEKDQDSNPLY